MYKCTDCGHEYNNKPDYCECGNNAFEEVITEQNHTPDHMPTATPALKTEPKSQFKSPFDPISVTIFLVCIILSILSIIFIGKDDQNTGGNTNQNKAHTEKTQKQTLQKMPSIDNLWTEPRIENKKIEESTQETITTPEPIIKQIIQPQANPKTVQKPVLQKPAASSAPQPQTKKTQTLTPAKPAAPSVSKPTVNSAAAQQELIRYKAALRNKIASDINFAAIAGDGRCAISFKIDTSGNLINRAFVKQSDNDSLNDMVYGAMMQNPSFRTPPSAYKNETLKITVKMYSGNYEVSLD